MKKNLLFVLIILTSFNSFSQISFEKGYYTDNSNNKVDCLIRNVDWKNNPTQIEYKLSDDSKNNTLDISSIKEFGIYNESKYVRANVNIERSNPNSTNALSESGEPIYNKEKLFLKVLIEGKANLYVFTDGNLTKYFFSVDDFPIEQLIFIKYKMENSDIKLNQYYKQQLWLNLKCDDISMSDINKVNFKKNDLINFFIKYNGCNQSEFVNYNSKLKKDFFNLTFKPRINYSSLKIINEDVPHRNTNFGNSVGYGFGLEFEFVLPFNKDKWSIFIDASYSSIKYKNVSDNVFIPYLPDGKIYGKADIKSLEIPIGVRHYFYINDKSRIFINLALTFNSYLNSTVEFDGVNNSYHLNTLDMNGSTSLSYGIGYNYNKKLNFELRQYTKKDFLGNYASWQSDYKSLVSVIFGYTIF